MIRSLKNGNFYGKSINLKVGSSFLKNFPGNQTKQSKNHINIAIFPTFIVLNSNFYEKMLTFFTKKTSDFTRGEQLLLP